MAAAAGTAGRKKAARPETPGAAASAPEKRERPATDATPETTAGGQGKDAVLYRVLAPCRVGHYREPGEVFGWPRFDPCPPYREEAHQAVKTADPGPENPPAAPGATLADILPAR